MKLRIAVLLATAALVIVIIVFLRDWRQSHINNDIAAPSSLPLKANPIPSSQVISDEGARPSAASAGSLPVQAAPSASTMPGTITREQGSIAVVSTPVPRVAVTKAPVVSASTPVPRARMSPADPLVADADRNAGAIELDKVSLMLRDYRTRMGENPVGTNAEIMKAVMGGNPKGALLGPPEGQKLNGDGELVDRWGKPYFFHQLSRTSMEIRSAGPDQQLYTEDDVIVH